MKTLLFPCLTVPETLLQEVPSATTAEKSIRPVHASTPQEKVRPSSARKESSHNDIFARWPEDSPIGRIIRDRTKWDLLRTALYKVKGSNFNDSK